MANFCTVCNISVSAATEMSKHHFGRRHCAMLRQQNQKNRTVFVKGFADSITTDDLAKAFSAFGPVEAVHINIQKTYAFVEFLLCETVPLVLNTHVNIGGRQLTVKPRSATTSRPRNTASSVKTATCVQPQCVMPVKEFDHEGMLQRMRQLNDISEQMVLLETEHQLGTAAAHNRTVIRETILQHLSKYLRDCELITFGSTASSLATVDSDLDCLLDLHPDPAEISGMSKKSLRSCEIGYLLSRRKHINRAELLSLSEESLVRLCARIIYSCRDFRVVAAILNARCPVLKLQHLQTNISCDISFGSRLSTQNTCLVAFLVTFDPRVRTLLHTLRYWHSCVVCAQGGTRLTNYALCMITFLYLQTLDEPVLPSIGQLMDAADDHERCAINDWQCGFTMNTSRLPTMHNTHSPAHLLIGFFRFLLDIDFDNCVLMMRSAELMDGVRFAKMVQNDPKLCQFKKSSMIVQDPFDLSHNITSGITEKQRDSLLAHCHASLNQLTNGATSPGCLVRACEVSSQALTQQQQAGYELRIPLQTWKLSEQFVLRHDNLSSLREQWFPAARLVVRRVLTEVLLFKCDNLIIGIKDETDASVTDSADFTNNNAEDSHCHSNYTGSNQLWIGRRKVNTADLGQFTGLDLEVKISAALTKNALRSKPMTFSLAMSNWRCPSGVELRLVFTSAPAQKDFVTLFNFLKMFLPRQIDCAFS